MSIAALAVQQHPPPPGVASRQVGVPAPFMLRGPAGCYLVTQMLDATLVTERLRVLGRCGLTCVEVVLTTRRLGAAACGGPALILLTDLTHASHHGARMGLKPAKQCIFLHLENLRGGIPEHPSRPGRDLPEPLALAGFSYLCHGAPKSLVLEGQVVCFVPLCPPFFFLLFLFIYLVFFFFFLDYASRGTHFSLRLGEWASPGTPSHPQEPTHSLGVLPVAPSRGAPPLRAAALRLPLPAHCRLWLWCGSCAVRAVSPNPKVLCRFFFPCRVSPEASVPRQRTQQ